MTDTLLPAGRDSALTDLVAELAATVAAMPALPADDGSRYSVRRLTVTWLLEAESRHTRAAHRRDLTTFLAWCERERLHPLTARTTDISQFRVWRELQTHRGKTAAASTVARGLASVSSWYTHLGANSTDPMRNPVATTKRPKVNNRTSTTAGITLDEVDRLLDQADTEARRRAADWRRDPSPARHIRCVAALRDQALLRLLADLGLRIDEALARNLTDLTFNAGRRTLTFTGKGGLKRERAVPETTMSPLTKYLSARAELTGTTVGALTGALFATTGTTGEGRLAQPNVFTWLRKLAATAGIPAASRLSPHSLRHAAATGAKQLGVQLEYVQDALGHADPRTTRRYDRDRDNLEHDFAHVLAAHRALPRGPSPSQIFEVALSTKPSIPGLDNDNLRWLQRIADEHHGGNIALALNDVLDQIKHDSRDATSVDVSDSAGESRS